jgi:hypothetical protein
MENEVIHLTEEQVYFFDSYLTIAVEVAEKACDDVHGIIRVMKSRQCTQAQILHLINTYGATRVKNEETNDDGVE